MRSVFEVEKLKKEEVEIESQMAAPKFWKNHEQAAIKIHRLECIKEELSFIERLYALVAAGDALTLEKELAAAEYRLYFSGPYDKGNAVISVYSGAGGDDAEDWTRILFEMYRKLCEKRGWSWKELHIHKNEHGGIKNATAEIEGLYAYGWLRKETGVHRLVRISPFSPKKLRHTSFALVEILPEIENPRDVEIQEEDIEVSFARSSGPGGQNVNKRETAVRVLHKPSGIQVHVETGRSQQQNREKAIRLLRAKLYQRRLEAAQKERSEVRGGKLPSAEWGHQIRSYVFHPYRQVKDHRTEVETSDVDSVLNGELDEFLEAELKMKNF